MAQGLVSLLRTLSEHEEDHFPQGERTWLLRVDLDLHWGEDLFTAAVALFHSGWGAFYRPGWIGLTTEGRALAPSIQERFPDQWRSAVDFYYGKTFAELEASE